MYCKYVINIINNTIKKIKPTDKNYKLLEDKLYKSYLKLEKILNYENS